MRFSGSVFATAGIVRLFRGLQKSACVVEALAKSQKRRPGPKDAVSGWTPVNTKELLTMHTSDLNRLILERLVLFVILCIVWGLVFLGPLSGLL
jgi:hypothetical protein